MVIGTVLELLRPKQSVGEISEQACGDDAGEPVVEGHGLLLEAVAGVGVGDRQLEKTKTNG